MITEALLKYKVKKIPPLKPESWYILDIGNLFNPRLLINKFEDVEEAKRAIRQELGRNFFKYRCIRGALAIKHNLVFKKPSMHRRRRITGVRNYKYEYPPGALGNKRAMIRHRDNTRNKLKRQKKNENNHI